MISLQFLFSHCDTILLTVSQESVFYSICMQLKPILKNAHTQLVFRFFMVCLLPWRTWLVIRLALVFTFRMCRTWPS